MNKLAFLFFFLTLFVACNNIFSSSDEKVTSDIEIDKCELVARAFPKNGGKQMISFTAKSDWKISLQETRSESWVSAYPMSGGPGYAEIWVSVDYNDTNDRSAVMSIECGEDKIDIHIEQTKEESEMLMFESMKFKKIISEMLGMDLNEDVYPEDVANITELDLSDVNLSDLSSIRFFPSLETLYCSGNNMTDLYLYYDSLSNLKLVDCSECNNLSRVWLPDGMDLSKVSIKKPSSADYCFLVSQNHIAVPVSNSFECSLNVRPDVTRVELDPNTKWATGTLSYDEFGQCKLVITIENKIAERSCITVLAESENGNKLKENIYIYTKTNIKAPSSSLISNTRSDKFTRASEEHHNAVEYYLKLQSSPEEVPENSTVKKIELKVQLYDEIMKKTVAADMIFINGALMDEVEPVYVFTKVKTSSSPLEYNVRAIYKVKNEKGFPIEYEKRLNIETVEAKKEILFHWNDDTYPNDVVSVDLGSIRPTIQVLNVKCGVTEGGEPVEWSVSAPNMAFYPNSGEGVQDVVVVIDANADCDSRLLQFTFRGYTATEGDEFKKFAFHQDGVYVKILTDNRKEFPYITSHPDGKVIYFPPQHSTKTIQIESNADDVRLNADLLKGEEYRNDVVPEFNASESDDLLNILQVTYPANYNYDVTDYTDKLIASADILRFKRRGMQTSYTPIVKVIDNWNKTDISEITYKEEEVPLDKPCLLTLIQEKIILDHNWWYYFAPPYSPSGKNKIYGFNEQFEEQRDNTIRITSNVSWRIDTEAMRQEGLICTSGGQTTSVSDGHSLVKTEFEMSLANSSDIEMVNDGLYAEPIVRSKGYTQSAIMFFPIIMDLNDGVEYSAYPAFIGQSGMPLYELEFYGSLGDVQKGKWYKNGHEYEYKLVYYVFPVWESDPITFMFAENLQASNYDIIDGQSICTWYPLKTIWEITYYSDSKYMNITHDARFSFWDDGRVYVKAPINKSWTANVQAVSTKSISVVSVADSTSEVGLTLSPSNKALRCLKKIPELPVSHVSSDEIELYIPFNSR